MQHTALTNVGLVRTENQDRHLILDLDQDCVLVAVSDGMGGEAGGGLAARLVVEALGSFKAAEPDPRPQLDQLVRKASDSILAEAHASPDLEGMGATAVAALVVPGRVYWVNLGDSRLYHFSKSGLRRVSRDHSFIQELLDAGDLTPEEAKDHPLRNVLDQCAGTPDARPDTGVFEALAGDVVLLCSDGLYNQMDDERMAQLLARDGSLDDRARALVDEALRTGGRDNVTVLLAEIPA